MHAFQGRWPWLDYSAPSVLRTVCNRKADRLKAKNAARILLKIRSAKLF
jgi:hypothetical protein